MPEGLGLYSVNGLPTSHNATGEVTFKPLYMGAVTNKLLVGAYVAVYGLALLASLHIDLPSVLVAGRVSDSLMSKLSFTSFSHVGVEYLYHPGAIVMSRKEGKPIFIALSWEGFCVIRTVQQRYLEKSDLLYPPKTQGRVVETKSSLFTEDLRLATQEKTRCGGSPLCCAG